jgi:hypothetical protein
MWKWIVGGSALLLIGGSLVVASEVQALDALTAVPSDAFVVAEIDLVELVLDLESDRFVSTFGDIREVWDRAARENSRDAATTVASVSAWAGPSVAAWLDFSGGEDSEPPAFCVDFSVIRKAVADDEIQNYLEREGWVATERKLENGSVWETEHEQYIGRIGRIVFICEGSADLVPATVRALNGDSILTVDSYRSTVSATNPGPATLWIDLPGLLDLATAISEADLAKSTGKLVDKLGPMAFTFDMTESAIAIRAFVSLADSTFIDAMLPVQDRSSELPAATMAAVFTAFSQEAIDLITDELPDGATNASPIELDRNTLVELLEVFKGDLAFGVFESDRGSISTILGMPADAQIIIGSEDPLATMESLNGLLSEAGLGMLLTTDSSNNAPTTRAGFGDATIAAWAARPNVFVFGSDPVAAATVGRPLDEAEVYKLAKQAQTSGMSTNFFVDIQRSLEFLTANDLLTSQDAERVAGTDSMIAMIAGAQRSDDGASLEWLLVMDW